MKNLVTLVGLCICCMFLIGCVTSGSGHSNLTPMDHDMLCINPMLPLPPNDMK